MDVLYHQTIRQLDKSFRRLVVMVPPPRVMRHGSHFVFRYQERTIQQALIQKLARTVSGLHAVRLLCHKGLFQEQGALQRTLDEFREDISFLALGVLKNDITAHHRDYLDRFYKEEFDPVTGAALLDRGIFKRKHIRSYLASIGQQPHDASYAEQLSRTIYSGFSGFVHGASSHIMDMWGGNPPRFHLHGMSGTPREEAHRDDLYHPFYRAIISFALVAQVFGDQKLYATLNAFKLEFERSSGR